MLGIPPVVFMGPGHEIFNRLRYVAVVFVSPWSSRRGHQKQMFWGVQISGPHRNFPVRASTASLRTVRGLCPALSL
jgi:hypothetical protein